MAKFITKIKDLLGELRRKVTIVFIHHGRIKPFKFNFSVLFLLVAFAGWTGMTLWAGFISGKHIDYLTVKADNKIMKARMLFFADQIKKSKEMLAQVKQNDDHIRSLLAMDSKRIIIENDLGAGGPTPIESSALSMLLSGKIDTIDYQEISKQSFVLLYGLLLRNNFSLKLYILQATQKIVLIYSFDMALQRNNIFSLRYKISSYFQYKIFPSGYRYCKQKEHSYSSDGRRNCCFFGLDERLR